MATAQVQLEAALADAEAQDKMMKAATDQISAMRSAIGDLTDQVDGALSDVGTPEQELRQELLINRAMLHLIRARLGLLENNAGLAAEEAGRARDLLVEMDPDGDVEHVQGAIARIEIALEAINATPLVAGDDLEIAWKLLVEGEATNE